MKQFLLTTLCVVCASFAFTQFPKDSLVHPADSVHRAYYAQTDSIYGGLDFSYIPSGILYDYGFPFLRLENFNGQLTDSSEASLLSFGLAYATLTTMQVDTTNALPGPDHYRSRMDTITPDSDVITIAGLHQEYHKIDTVALDSNWLSLSGNYLSDVLPRSQDPYIKHDLFMFTAAVHNVYNQTFNLMLDSNLFYTNTGKAIDSVLVRLKDSAAFNPVSFNTPFMAQYSTIGVKNITIKVRYTDSSTYYSNFNINVLNDSYRTSAYEPDIVHAIANTTGTNPWDGVNGGTVNVYLACGHEKIEKPFIWAEGFNPSFDRLDLNLTLDDAEDRLLKSETFNGDDVPLFDDLRANGYDIILLDYNDGGDYLPRTIAFIKEAIRWVNTQKASAGSTEKNVIMGQSMGGICTARALRQMENASEDHEVETFINFDAAMLGVNVPLGAQANLMDVATLPVSKLKILEGDIYIETTPLYEYAVTVEDALDLITTPAARTMIKYYADTEHYGVTSEDFDIEEEPHLYEGYYDTWHNSEGGMPEECDVICIANGSIKGIDGNHNFADGEKVVHAKANTMSVVTALASFLDGNSDGEDFSYINSFQAYAGAGMLVWASGLDAIINTEIYAVKHNEAGAAYYGNYFVEAFWGYTQTFSADVYTYDAMPGIDNAPGGYVGLENKPIIFENLDIETEIPESLLPDTYKLQTFCFTPAISVLNYQGGYTDLRFQDINNDFTDTEAELLAGNVKGAENYQANEPTVNISVTGGGSQYFENTAHTWFTPNNTAFVRYHLIGDDLLGSTSILTSSETFNYGKGDISADIEYDASEAIVTNGILENDLEVNNTTLGVNINDDIGLSTAAHDYPNTTDNSNFTLILGNSCLGDDVTLDITNGGQVVLGDGVNRTGTIHVNLASEIIIRDGSTLRIKEGSVIKLFEYGSIIIEDGGKLIVEDNAAIYTSEYSRLVYHKGATIELNGDGALLDMSGQLELKTDAVFKPIHDGVASGLIVVRAPDWLNASTGSTFSISGDNDFDPILTIAENGYIKAPSHMEKFQITNGIVAVRSFYDYALVVETDFISSSITYQAQSNLEAIDQHPIFIFYNKTTITSSDFEDIKLEAKQHYPVDGNFLYIKNSSFDFSYEQDETLLEVDGNGMFIFDSDFTNYGANSYAIRSAGLSYYSKIYNCDFIGKPDCEGAIIDEGFEELKIERCGFNYGDVGVIKRAGKLTLKCNQFQDFDNHGLWCLSGAYLEMSVAGGGGYNEFTSIDESAVRLLNAEYIQLDQGFNYFEDNSSTPSIEGTIDNSFPGVDLLTLSANRNKWNTSSTVPSSSIVDLRNSDTETSITITFTSPGTAQCGTNDPSLPIISLPLAPAPRIKTQIFTDSIRIDSAIAEAVQYTEAFDSTKNDYQALVRFEDILTYNYPTVDSVTRVYLNLALNLMTHTVQHSFSTGYFTQTQNTQSFSTPLQLYVNGLNALTDYGSGIIYDSTYRQQFQIELDKAELFWMIGKPNTTFEILDSLESCGLDSVEQATLNHSRFLYEEQKARWAYGPEVELLDTILTDTSGYTTPSNQQGNSYKFGSTINSISSLSYNACSQSNAPEYINTDDYKLSVYPNPTNSWINLEYEIDAESSAIFTLYSLDGKQVLAEQCPGKQYYNSFDLRYLENGIYIYTFSIDGELKEQGKIIKS